LKNAHLLRSLQQEWQRYARVHPDVLEHPEIGGFLNSPLSPVSAFLLRRGFGRNPT